MDTAVFHQFPLLPTELRLQIWKNVTFPRIIDLYIYPDTWIDLSNPFNIPGHFDQMLTSQPPPPLFSVCRESREVARTRYKHFLRRRDNTVPDFKDCKERLEWKKSKVGEDRDRLKDPNFLIPVIGTDACLDKGTNLSFDMESDIFYLNTWGDFWATEGIAKMERWMSSEFIRSIKYLAIPSRQWCSYSYSGHETISRGYLVKMLGLKEIILTLEAVDKDPQRRFLPYGSYMGFIEHMGRWMDDVAGRFSDWNMPEWRVNEDRASLVREWEKLYQ